MNLINSIYFIKKNKTIIIILIIIIIFINLIKYKENYDGKLISIKSIEDCAEIASSIYNVSAFSYDPSGSVCFISKTPLTRPPIQIHPYHNDFKITDKICNKLNFIRDQKDTMNNNNLISNRLYSCYDNTLKNDSITQYYFQKNKPKLLIKNQDPARLPVSKNNFFTIDYPKEKEELNNIDISYKMETDNYINFNKTIKNISWKPSIMKEVKELNPLDVYDDTNNFNLFKLKKSICINQKF